jgi:hypothetical protein
MSPVPERGPGFFVAVPRFGMEIPDRMFHGDRKPRNEGQPGITKGREIDETS